MLTPSRLCAWIRWLFCALVIGAAVACSPYQPSDDPVSVAVPQFQRKLDHLGVPYTVPPTGKAILVNIPAFELIAFEDGRPAFRSRIIVGTPENPTPLMTSSMRVVRFRPMWRPTPSMIESGEYRDKIWPPGRQNPLGLAAIRLRTDIPIYLHDTNRRDLFGQRTRALSHGCVRVEHWDTLVSWTLDMALSQVHRLANGSQTIDVATPDIPVQFGYFLRFPNATGELVAYPDIYGRGTIAVSRGSAEG
jgi:murein L,D-transpeptidase YcbB/YkuD